MVEFRIGQGGFRGRRMVHAKGFLDWAEALEAAGLSEVGSRRSRLAVSGLPLLRRFAPGSLASSTASGRISEIQRGFTRWSMSG